MLDRDRARPPRPPPKTCSTMERKAFRSGTPKRRARSQSQATARYRARLAAGEKVYGVVADDAVLEYLIATLWLDRALSGDKVEVAKAISRMLADSAKG